MSDNNLDNYNKKFELSSKMCHREILNYGLNFIKKLHYPLLAENIIVLLSPTTRQRNFC